MHPIPPASAPPPPHVIVWRVTRPRAAAAALLAALQAAALPGWGAVRASTTRTTLYLWTPSHQAALLDQLVATRPSGAAPVPAWGLPTGLRWHPLPGAATPPAAHGAGCCDDA